MLKSCYALAGEDVFALIAQHLVRSCVNEDYLVDDGEYRKAVEGTEFGEDVRAVVKMVDRRGGEKEVVKRGGERDEKDRA